MLVALKTASYFLKQDAFDIVHEKMSLMLAIHQSRGCLRTTDSIVRSKILVSFELSNVITKSIEVIKHDFVSTMTPYLSYIALYARNLMAST